LAAVGGNREMTVKIRPHAGLSRALIVIVKIMIGVLAVGVLAGIYAVYTYVALPAHIDPNETIFKADIVWSLVRLVRIPVWIITLIVFFWWVYRTNKNLRTLSKSWMEFTPGWSVGWFFIPIANFWKPYQVMKEIWKASHGDDAPKESLVGWWWAMWLISGYAGRVISRLGTTPSTASGYATEYLLMSVLDGLDLALWVVTLMLVTRIRAAYARNIVEPRGREYGGPAAAAPPPLA
jgi:hypothetical protein